MRITTNQYLFIKGKANNIEYDSKYDIFDYTLYCGQKIRTFLVQNHNKFVLLLGYVIDAFNPHETELQLCKKILVCKNKTVEEITESWNGRWVLFEGTDLEIKAWNDCCGLKQLFYVKTGFALASQARYIAEYLNIPENNDAKKFLNEEKLHNKEFSFPVDSTMYYDIKRLLPNHKYNSSKNEAKRIYYKKTNVVRNLDDISSLLTNSIKGTLSRYEFVVETLTAGLDSRIVLAHSKDFLTNIKFVTFKYIGMNDNHYDLYIPRQLKETLNLNYSIIECSDDNIFKEKYIYNSEHYHDYWIQMAKAVSTFDADYPLLIKGSCSEILRNPFGPIPNHLVNSHILCKLFQISSTDFSIDAINNWIKYALPFCNYYNLRLVDLFYWEHRMGNWLSTCLNESDFVYESFTPFNIRCALFDLLKYNDKERISPNYSLFQQIINKKMPEIIHIKINPGRYSTLLSKVKCVIKNNFSFIYLKII